MPAVSLCKHIHKISRGAISQSFGLVKRTNFREKVLHMKKVDPHKSKPKNQLLSVNEKYTLKGPGMTPG